MFRRSSLLKVISTILIIMGILGVFGSIATLSDGNQLAEAYAVLGMEAPSMLSNILSCIGAIIILVSGIIGAASKSKKTILIIGVLLCAYYLLSIIYSSVTLGFSPLNCIGLIVPILYMWGWYQTN